MIKSYYYCCLFIFNDYYLLMNQTTFFLANYVIDVDDDCLDFIIVLKMIVVLFR